MFFQMSLKQAWTSLKQARTPQAESGLFLSFERREKNLCLNHIFRIRICKKRFITNSHFNQPPYKISVKIEYLKRKIQLFIF